MDRWEAQYNFWSAFGVPAYEENSVPDLDCLTFPYITYKASASGFDEPVTITASIWDRGTSWQRADTLADSIEHNIRTRNPSAYDNGMYRIYIGNTPFAQNMGDPGDDQIKRKLLTVVFEFMEIRF